MESRIESMAPGGFGIARIEGRVHFVPETVTGDVVEIEEVSKKRHHTFSRLVRILEPSPSRRNPFCPWYGACGGCDFQHITYPEQLRIKQEIFRNQMQRIGKFEDPETPEILGSKSKRVRMRFQIGNGEVGLFRRRTNRICAMTECAVADPTINKALQVIRKGVKEAPGRSALEGEVTIIAAGGKAHLFLDLPLQQAMALSESMRPPVVGCILGKREMRRITGKPSIPLKTGGVQIDLPADVFVQANREINEAILPEIRAFMEGTNKVVDLYCGCGNFTFPLSRACGEVTGIETSPAAVESARKAALRAKIGNLSFFCRPAAEADLSGTGGIVLDPPRPGLSSGLIKKILRALPRRIAYLSCNPATQARDLRLLVDGGYTIESIRLFDMFPETHHIESLALMRLK
ncbi:MAG: class I SAM-dependent RNA methyltransferase [Deltaproteobacteria bacterium]|nr:class I SAM-dependent RNA methyltransferase [Deltaproteobacteria bacterium]